MSEHTDTERLDWMIANFIGSQTDEGFRVLAGAMLMGLAGRAAIDAAIDGTVPLGVMQAAVLLGRF